MRPAPLGALLWSLWASWGLCACGEPETEALPRADFARFASAVQPVLEARCANPSCHGNDNRALEIYAPELHRLNPDEVFLKTALTHTELRANFLRASAFIDDFDGSSSLLRKPLAEAQGGMGHEGGVCFESRDDAEWQVLRGWVRDALASEEAP